MIEFLNDYWYLVGAISTFAATFAYIVVTDDDNLNGDEMFVSSLMAILWVLMVPTVILVVIAGTIKDKFSK